MSDELYPVAGAKIYIGPGGAVEVKKTDLILTDFTSAITDPTDWVEIDGWETTGALNDATQNIALPIINRKRDFNAKGTVNANAIQMQFAELPADLGQIALYAAGASRLNFPFKIVWDDSPGGVGAAPSESLFVGLVSGVGQVGGGANTMRLLSAMVQRNSNVVIKPITPAT